MRVHIIQPTHFAFPFQKKLFKTKKRDLIPLTLPYLAALIPEGIETRITDEQVQDWDPEAPCDCVFISVHILNSFRAYEIADAYRAKGIPVVMGGPHSTFYGDEVLEHADAIAVGEGETLVPEILDDLTKGRLKPRYQASELRDLRGLPFPRHDLLDPSTLSRFRTVAIQTTRGCP
ncbi:MAG: B12-binding domain-containing radical SAM protein, partial [Thermodesulfobacteriota bacterium]